MNILDKLFTLVVTVAITIMVIGVVGVGIAFLLMYIQM